MSFQINCADNSELFSSDLAKKATKRALKKPKLLCLLSYIKLFNKILNSLLLYT